MNKTATVVRAQTRKQRRLAARRSRPPGAAPAAPRFRLKHLTVAIRTAIPVTLLGLPVAPQAGPEGGVVTAGSGIIARPDAQTTNIQQHSQNLILNWDSYNVQANEAVNYRQPNANAQALNRILDHNPSQIFGQINANGRVLLVNPNGVFFKPGARVNVGGLVASGLNISDKDFLAGKYHFAHDGKGAPGAVINQGLIQAATGGAVSLIGGAVKNEGTILAHAGQVNLVAGRAMAMDFDGDGLIQFAVTEELLERAEGLEAAVSNTGTIKAEGGAVLLKGRAARDVFTQVVNNSGVIGAGRVEKNGGVIRLVAKGAGSSLLNTGTLNAASEKGAGGAVKLEAGGKVEVSGEARITVASGSGQGGRIDISGADVAVSDSALITAASAAGKGQTGDALLDVDSSFRWNDDGGGNAGGGGAINNGEAKKSKGLAANTNTRHSGAGRNPGKTTHSGDSRNDNISHAGGTIKIKASNKVAVTGKARITAASGVGRGGRIDISGGDVVVSGQAWLDVSGGAVSGGAIKIKASNKVAVTGKARITAASGVGRGGQIDISGGDVAVSGSARLDVSGGAVSGGAIKIKASNKVAVTDKARITAASGVGQGGRIDISGGDVVVSGSARLDVSGGAVSGGAIKIKASNKVAVSDKARITAVSGTGKGGRIDISGADVAVSGQARLDVSSGLSAAGKGQTGDALLNVDSSFRWNDGGGGNDVGGGVRNDGEGAGHKGLATNTNTRHSSESWNPGKTTHSGGSRNDIISHAGGTIKIKASNKVAVTDKARITAVSGTGKGGQIDISGGEVSISDSALITAASGVGQTRHSSLPAAGRRSWNPGKTPHSGAGRNAITGLAGGTIKLKAQNKAVVSDKAQITVASETGKGGRIEITGDKVGLLGQARLDASGAAGGGGILVGGDYQGKNPAVRNARITYIGKNARLSADAKTKGKGGRIIVWADDTTRYHGQISARGGAQGGDGGFVEVSGKRYLAFRGEVDVAAPKGRAGTLLLDPDDLCIGGTATSNSCGGTARNPTPEDTTNPFDAASDTANSWVSQATLTRLATGGANISLQANNDIFFDSNISLGAGFTGTFRLTAGNDINMNGYSLTLAGATVLARFFAGRHIRTGVINITNGNIELFANRNIILAALTAGGADGSVTIGSDGVVSQTGAITTPTLNINHGDWRGQYNLDTQNNAITTLDVRRNLRNNLRFRDDTGFQVTGFLNTSSTRGGTTTPHTITLNSAGAITQATNAKIEGTGTLVKRGAGTLTLSERNNEFTGRLRIEAGRVHLSHSGNLALENGIVDFQNPAATASRLTHANNQTIAGLAGGNANSGVEIQRGAILTINNARATNTTFGGVLKDGGGSGSGNLTIAGQGMLTLSRAYTYTGAITIKGWTGAASAEDSEKNGSRLTVLRGGPTSGTITVEKYGSIIFGDTTFASNILGAPLNLSGPGAWSNPDPAASGRERLGALRKQGSARPLGLTGAITLSGDTTIKNASPNRELTIWPSGTPGNDATLALGAYNLTLDAARPGGTINLGARIQLVSIPVGSDIHTPTATVVTGRLTVTGTGKFIKAGPGRLVLGTPSYGRTRLAHTGETEIRGGTFSVSPTQIANGGINNSNLRIKGGTLSIGATNYTINSLRMEGGAISGTGTLMLNTGNYNLRAGTVNAVLGGSAGLHKEGAGLATLARANTYTGATQVYGGTLRINHPNGLGAASGNVTINRNAILESAVATSSQPLMFRTGQALTLNGGTLRLRKSYTDTTARTVGNAITLTEPATSTIGRDSVSFIEHTLVGPANATANCGLTACDRTTTLSANLSLGHTLGIRTNKGGNLTGNYNSKLVLSGNLQRSGTNTRTGLVKEGAGDLRLSGTSNNYTGPTTINGGSLTLGRTNAIPTNSRLIINNGATLNMGDFNQTLKGLRLNDGSITANARLGTTTTATTLDANARGVLTVTARDPDETAAQGLGEFDVRKGAIAAILRGDKINLVKRSDGTATAANPEDIGGTVRLSFTGAHPLTGGNVTIEAGRLIIDGTLAGGNLSVRGTYDLKGVNRSWTNVTLISGRIIDTGTQADADARGALTVSGTFNLQSGTVSAKISGAGALVKNQVNDTTPGKVTLSNAGNDYTGDITINKGTLAITHAGALGTGTSAITVNSGGTLALEPATGSLTLNRALNLVGGALASLSGNNNIWSGAISLRGTAANVVNIIRSAAGSTLTVNRNLSLQFGATPTARNLKIKGMGNVVLSGVISGLGGLIKGDPAGDAGRLTLSGDNTFAGAVTVNHGVLRVEHNNALGTAPANATTTTTVNDGATLDLAGGMGNLSIASTESLTLSGAGAASVPGEAKLRNISGNNTLNGNIRLRNDVPIHAAANTTLTLAGVISRATAVISAVGLSKTGAGTLKLTGINTYQGDTSIDEGELELDNASGNVIAQSANVILANAGSPKLSITRDQTLRSLQGGGEVAITSGQRLTVNQIAGANTTYNGVISGTGAAGLSKTGTGTLTLSGQNTYAGTTLVNAGKLAITHNDALGATGDGNETTVASGATLELRGRTSFDASGTLNGYSNITVAENLTLNGGTLRNLHGFNTLSGTITLGADSLIDSHRDEDTVVGTIDPGQPGCPGTVACESKGLPGRLTLSGVISSGSNNYGLTKLGLNNLVLSGANTYGGRTIVAQGALTASHNSALGATAGGTIVYNNANLSLQGNIAIGAEALTLAGGSLNSGTGNNSWAGDIALGFTRVRNNDGTVTTGTTSATSHIRALLGNLRITGNISLRSGMNAAARAHTLEIFTTPAFGATPASAVTISGNISGAGGKLTKLGGGKLTLSGTNSYTGLTQIGRAATTAALAVSGGELELQGGNAIADNGAVALANVANTRLTVTRGETIGALSGGGAAGGNIQIESGQTLTVNQSANTSYNGLIRGAGGLEKTGTGALTLGGANTYGGTTLVSGGALIITNSRALGATGAAAGTTVNTGAILRLGGNNLNVGEALTLAGGTLDNPAGDNEYSGAITLTGTGTLASAAGHTLTVSGNIGGAGGLSKTGAGTLTLSGTGDNTYAGATQVAAGILRIRKSSALGSTAGATTVSNGATLELDSANGNLSIAETLSLAGNGVLGDPGNPLSGIGALRNVRGNNTLSGTITLAGDVRIYSAGGATHRLTISGNIGQTAAGSNFGLEKTGAGKLTLTGTNTYTGVTNIDDGELEVANTDTMEGNQGAIHDSSAVDLGDAAGARLTVTNSETIGSLYGGGAAGGHIQIESGQTLSVNQTADGDEYNGRIRGAGNLVKKGGAELTLAGANDYRGTTRVEEGTLAITRSSGLGTTDGGTTVSNGATLRLDGDNLNVAEGLTLSGTLANTGDNEYSGAMTLTDTGTLDSEANSTLTVTGNIGGTGGLQKTGAGMVALMGRGANTYAGATRVNAGILRIGKNSALGSTAGNTTVAAGATLQLAAPGTGSLTITENLELAGGALGNLRGNNTYSGSLTLSAASLIQSAAGALTVTPDLRLQAAGSTGAAWNLTVKGAGDVILSGRISGAGGLIKGTAGTSGTGDTGRLTLSGTSANAYRGATAVNHGVLRIRKAGALGAATAASTDDTTVAAGATLELDPETGNLTIDANEGLSLAGEGALSASARLGALRNTRGDNTISGNIALTGNATLHVGAGATLTVTGAIGHASGAAAGASFGLSKTGAGRLTLNGQNTYTGLTNIKQGALAIGRSNGINRASRLVVGQLRRGATAAVPGEFILGAYNQTFSGVQLNAGSITASPVAPTTAGNASTGQGVLTVTPRRDTARTAANQGVGEFDLRAGEIQAILNGPADIIKDSDGTTTAGQTPTGRAEDIGGVVTLTYTGDHLYTGSVSILAGRLVVRGKLPSSILIVRGGVHDLRGRRESYRGVRLISGSIIDSGRDGEGGERVKGSLTVDRDDTRSGESYGEFDLRSGTVSATLAGSGALVKRTDGTTAATSRNPGGIVTLSGNNSYSGQTTVEAGVLRVTHANALGTPATGETTNTTVRSGATLQLAGGVSFSNRERLTLSGQGVTGSLFRLGGLRLGALHSLSGNNTWNGAINLGAAATINAQAAFVPQTELPPGRVYTLRLAGQINNQGHNLTLSAFPGVRERPIQGLFTGRRAAATIEVSPDGAGPAITGAGGLLKIGNGRVTLARASDYTGQTTINAGELRLTHAEALPGAVNLGIVFDGTTRAQLVVAANATIGSLSGGAPSTASGNALNNGRIIILKGYTLTINQTTAGTYGSRIIERDPDPVPASPPAGANLVKTGAARLTLTGDSAYTGTTTVSGGALNIRQPNALGTGTGAAGRVTVNTGGTLELQFNPGARTFGKNLRLAGPGARSNPADPESARLGALRSISGTNTLSGAITLTNNATIHNANTTGTGNSLILSGGLGGPHTLTVAGAGNTLISSVMAMAAGGLLKRGAGVLTLTAANTYTGRTDIQEGELILNHSGGNALHNTSAVNLSTDNSSSNSAKLSVRTNETIGALSGGSATGGNVEISKGVTLTVNSVAGATTYNGLILEVGAASITTRANLSKTGAGRLTLTRPNQYTGTTTVSGGVLAITSNLALGTGAGAAGGVTVNGGTLELATSGAVSFPKLLTLHGSGHANQGALRNVSGLNTWAGAITLGDAALIRNLNSATGNSLILSGGVSGTNRDLTVAGAGNTLISSALATGTGNLRKQSAGTLTLSGTNTYTGKTDIDGGTLAITSSGALGAGTVTVNSGGVLALSSNPGGTGLTLNRALILNGGALGNVRGDNTYSGNLTLTDSSTIRSTSGTLTVSGNLKLQTDAVAPETTPTPHDLTVAGAGNVVLSRVISGAGGLNKTGGGTLTLSGANTYSGDTLVRGGTLALGASERILNTGKLVIDGGTFSMGAFNETVGGLELKGNGNISGTGTLTLNNAGAGEANRRNFILESGTVGVILAGSAGLIKQGAADTLVTLARANTYTGATAINGGTLRINDPNGLGGTGASSGTTINSGGILESALASGGTALMINAAESLTLNGGILRLRKEYSLTDSSATTFSNTITLGADSAIEHIFVGPGSGNFNCRATVCDRATNLSGNLSLQSTSGGTTTGHTLTIRTRKTGNLVGNFISSVVLSGNISGAGGLIKEGAGDLRLTGTSNTYTGKTTINGGSITLTKHNAISTASRLIINNGATLNMGNFNQTLRGLQLNDGNITANARLGTTTEAALGATARGVLTVTPARAAADPDGKGEFDVRKGTIAAILRGTNINLVKRSDGTTTAADPDDIGGTVRLSFRGAHPLTGEVTIEAGRLIIEGTLSGGVLTVRGTYDLKGVNRNWTGVRLVSGRIIDSGREVTAADGTRSTAYGALTVSGQFNLESGLVSARLSGAGALNKNAATGENTNTVTLSNAGNDYTGLTSVNNGTLAITNSGALGAGAIRVNSGGTLELAPDAGSNLDLNRGLTLAGGALASLRGNNIWRGNVGLTANSTIRSAAGSTLDVRGPLSLQSGETPAARNLTIRGAGNVILSGLISGLGGLIKGVAATDSGPAQAHAEQHLRGRGQCQPRRAAH